MEPIKLTFYSGKLWHSDKPFPEHMVGDQSKKPVPGARKWNKQAEEQKQWLSTAYEVVNPEAALVFNESPDRDITDRIMYFGNGEEWGTELKDGDQITLPEGYGIEKKESWGPFHENTFAERIATITLPEKPAKVDSVQWQDIMIGAGDDYPVTEYAKSKPDNSANGYTQTSCDSPLCSCQHEPGKGFRCAAPHLIGRKVEPSESQEEQIHIWCDVFKVMDTTAHYKVEQELLEKFTITRK